jgi:hypothetical protein
LQWFSQFQHGFREEKSTESTAHKLIERIESGFKRKDFTACVFLDIKAALDSAWHPVVMPIYRVVSIKPDNGGVSTGNRNIDIPIWPTAISISI